MSFNNNYGKISPDYEGDSCVNSCTLKDIKALARRTNKLNAPKNEDDDL